MQVESERTPTLTHVGVACGLGWAIASVAALPTALRAARGGVSFGDAWLIGAAVWVCLLVPITLIAPRAARGWRGVVGAPVRPALLITIAMAASLGAIAVPILGAILHARTHHRGLGGAAFGIGSLVVLLGSTVIAARLTAFGESLRARGASPERLAIVPFLLAVLAMGSLVLPFRSSGSEAAALRATIGDVLLGVSIAATLVPRPVPETLKRSLRVVGLPLAVFTTVAGGIHAERSSAVHAIVGSGGVPGFVLGTLHAWSDRDEDGAGAHFGGRDCDEGDPLRHPGALDREDDGVDSDCDGRDAPSLMAASASSVFFSPEIGTPSTPDGPPPAATNPPIRHDIIVVTLDTVRADRTSLYGFDRKTTPNLERLAERGTRFDHAYAVAADMQRALAPVVSGRAYSDTPHRRGEWPRIEDEADLVAERVQRAGYRTGAVTSFPWLRRERGFAQGFEIFDESAFDGRNPERHETSRAAIDAAIATHRTLATSDAPLLLWVHLFDAHDRYLTHAGFDFGGKGDEELYLREIAHVDRELGRLIDAVSTGPRGSRTTWVVHGSHGEAFGEHGPNGHGAQVFDEVLHVPLLISGPPASVRRVAAGVSVLDVAATVLDLAAADRSGIAGASLVPAILGESFSRPPIVAHAIRRVAVIDWPLKVIRYRPKTGKAHVALFDLASDPKETRNLARSRPDDARRLDALGGPHERTVTPSDDPGEADAR